jgi:hypothetical protein
MLLFASGTTLVRADTLAAGHLRRGLADEQAAKG